MIEKELRQYKTNKSNLRLIELEERKLFKSLEDNEDTTYIGASRITDMPKAHNTTSAVENIAIEREEKQVNKAQILRRLEQFSREKFEIQCEVDKVDALLMRLSMEERFVIEMHYIEGLCWSLVIEKYRKEFGQFRSIPTLKRMRDNAIQMIKIA